MVPGATTRYLVRYLLLSYLLLTRYQVPNAKRRLTLSFHFLFIEIECNVKRIREIFLIDANNGFSLLYGFGTSTGK